MVLPDRERLRAAMLRSQQGRSGIEQPSERAIDAVEPSKTSDATPPQSQAPESASGANGGLRAMLQQRLASQRESRARVELPPGEVRTNAVGSYWSRTLRYPEGHVHGRIELSRALQLDGELLAKWAKDPRFATLRTDECLFFDTETTGLSGGAGTMVFTVGLGWFEGADFVLEQLFMRDFGEEPAMLQAVAQRLEERPVPVSFVGKSFDRHRIAARLAVHRMSAPILTDRHLDLYYAARRAFGKELPDCKLRTVEERRLGLVRDCDLPGSEAPIAYLQWIRDGRGPVDRVLEHNRLDVLSVAALLGFLAGR